MTAVEKQQMKKKRGKQQGDTGDSVALVVTRDKS